MIELNTNSILSFWTLEFLSVADPFPVRMIIEALCAEVDQLRAAKYLEVEARTRAALSDARQLAADAMAAKDKAEKALAEQREFDRVAFGNLARALCPESCKCGMEDSALAEFDVGAMGACQIIRRHREDTERLDWLENHVDATLLRRRDGSAKFYDFAELHDYGCDQKSVRIAIDAAREVKG